MRGLLIIALAGLALWLGATDTAAEQRFQDFVEDRASTITG